MFIVSNPDAVHIRGFLDVFGAFEVEVVCAGRKLEWAACGPTRKSREPRPLELCLPR
jgi:hypothetical protein